MKIPLRTMSKITQPKWHVPAVPPAPAPLYLYNSLTRQKEEFRSIKPGEISWYSCGPTVYDLSHMGHARNYVTIDLNRRVLQDYFGYNVKFVQNVTDIDDKIIIRARQNYLFELKIVNVYKSVTPELLDLVRQAEAAYVKSNLGLEPSQLDDFLSSTPPDEKPKEKMHHRALTKAHKQILNPLEISVFLEDVKDVLVPKLDADFGSLVTDPKLFLQLPAYWEGKYEEDMKKLNVLAPSVKTRVSEYVPEIVEYVQKIVDNGYAYEADGSVYFDTKAFEEHGHPYAKLQPWNKGQAGLIAEGEGSLSLALGKKNASDFALWKGLKPGEPAWPLPWGPGRPGWHIECSVMASDVLGSQMDIHSGGIDLAFPHHDNELAQAEAFFDCNQWVNYFLHTGHLHIEGQKMSKSLKNFITIEEALKKYSARELRLCFALVPWNSQLDFKELLVQQARAAESAFSKFFLRARALNGEAGFRAEKPTQADREVLDYLSQTRSNVHAAFCDNLAIGSAIRSLLELVNITNLKEPGVRTTTEVAIYITKVLDMLGFPKREDGLGWSDGGEAGELEGVKLEFGQAISKVRDDIRLIGIATKNKELMALSDRIRDVDLLNLGVSVDDRSQGNGLVKVLTEKEKADLLKQRAEKEAKALEKERKKKEAEEKAKQKEKEKLEKMKINPKDMFKGQGFKEFDEEGIPTVNADGTEVSKSARKKMLKQWGTQKKLYDEYLKSQEKND